jgi:hypothetical protein
MSRSGAPKRDPIADASSSRERALWSARDWWEDLVWPRVFASPLQGLRTWRVLLAFFAILLVGLVLSAGLALDHAWKDRPAEWPWEAVDVLSWIDWGWRYAVGLPKGLVSARPLTTIVAGPIALAAWLISMGALCRGSAVEMATGRRASWTVCLGFSLRRWRSVIGCTLVSLFVVWGLSLAIAAGGLLLRAPVLDVIAAIAFPILIVLGAVAMLLILGYALGHCLLMPAVACDGADAIDAVQRAMAYVFGRPLRLMLYLVLASVSLGLVVGVAVIVIVGGLGFAARSGGLFAGERGDGILLGGLMDALSWSPFAGASGGSASVAERIVRFWCGAALMMIPAIGVSCACSAATGVYLGIRRIADGQDMAEIHEPGRVELSMAETMDSRARAIGAVTPTDVSSDGGDADYN